MGDRDFDNNIPLAESDVENDNRIRGDRELNSSHRWTGTEFGYILLAVEDDSCVGAEKPRLDLGMEASDFDESAENW